MSGLNRHRRHANPFNVRGPVERINIDDLYSRDAPLALDVGFGTGMFLLDIARLHPKWNVLGAEIRKHLPHFTINYDIDPVRQSIAESWPDRVDDSAARREWGWEPAFDVAATTRDMLMQLREE